jgi:hypothetical protein
MGAAAGGEGDVPSLRPRYGRKLRRALFLVVLVAVAGWLVGLGVRTWDNHQRAAVQAQYRTAMDEAQPWIAQLEQHLDGVQRAMSSTATAAPRCPDAVTGPLPLIQAPWLAWLTSGRDPATSPDAVPYALSSDAFDELAGVYSPPADDSRSLAGYDEDLQAAASARYVVVFTASAVHPIRADPPNGTFSGGDVAGELTVVDVDAARPVCAAPVVSQALVAIWLEQPASPGEGEAERLAEDSSMVSSFWDQARQALRAIAPGARLVRSGSAPGYDY